MKGDTMHMEELEEYIREAIGQNIINSVDSISREATALTLQLGDREAKIATDHLKPALFDVVLNQNKEDERCLINRDMQELRDILNNFFNLSLANGDGKMEEIPDDLKGKPLTCRRCGVICQVSEWRKNDGMHTTCYDRLNHK